MTTKMTGVREYAEKMEVELFVEQPDKYNGLDRERLVIQAYNEGGHNSTSVDLLDLLYWLRTNRPDLMREVMDVSTETKQK